MLQCECAGYHTSYGREFSLPGSTFRERTVERFGEAKREDIDKLLLSKLSDALTTQQKANWIKNLLQEMRREGSIRRIGAEAGPRARWELSKPGDEAKT